MMLTASDTAAENPSCSRSQQRSINSPELWTEQEIGPKQSFVCLLHSSELVMLCSCECKKTFPAIRVYKTLNPKALAALLEPALCPFHQDVLEAHQLLKSPEKIMPVGVD